MGPIQGIDDSTQTLQRVPFDIETLYNTYKTGGRLPFPNAYMQKVECKAGVKKEFKLLQDVKIEPNTKPTVEQVTPESIRYFLNFHFTSPDGIQEYVEQIWEVNDEDQAKAANKNRMANQRIAHIFEAFMGANTAGEYLNMKKVLTKDQELTWRNYFSGLARIFNTAKEGGTPIFMEGDKYIPVRIKLTRNRFNKKNPNEVKMPLGNVIERYIKDAKSTTLSVSGDDEFNMIEKPKPLTGPAGPAGGGFGPAPAKTETGWDTVEDGEDDL